MIRHEHPGVYSRICCCDVSLKPVQKQPAVLIVFKNRRFIYSAQHDVMKRAGNIKSCLSWHVASLFHSYITCQPHFSTSVTTSPKFFLRPQSSSESSSGFTSFNPTCRLLNELDLWSITSTNYDGGYLLVENTM